MKTLFLLFPLFFACEEIDETKIVEEIENTDNSEENENQEDTDDSTIDSNDSSDGTIPELGCELLTDEPQTVQLASSQSESAQALILSTDATSYLLRKEEGQQGWLTIEVDDWMAVIWFFSSNDVEYTIHGGEVLSPIAPNDSCPDDDISIHQWTVHEWGSYSIEFPADAPSDIWFAVIKD